MAGSKLLAACSQVEALIDDLTGAAMQHIEIRIHHGTLLEQVIPKALKDGTYDGTTLEAWKHTAEVYKDKRTRKVAECASYANQLIKMLDDLEEQVKKYTPEMKKSQKLSEKMLPVARQAEREKKKKAATALIASGRELARGVQSQISS